MKSVIIVLEGGVTFMKKIAISSALLALMLAACGTNEAEPTTQDTEEQSTAAETSQSTEQQAEQSEQQTEEQNNNTTAGSSTTGSSTANSSANTSNSGQAALENKTLTLYASNEDATQIVPFEVQYEGGEDELVPFIFEKVDVYDTNLIDYSFENEGTSLVLNIDDTIFNVQGSAGGSMYTGSLVQSYFDNFPALNDVTFLYNGSSEPISDHISIGQPYGRGDITNIAQ